ncbi:hypothetical protein C8F01DRAFT_1253160 [Mycena amicta]|nr:hypothetical protein C8F01DRAFT_1253160 [Mycena amicta]
MSSDPARVAQMRTLRLPVPSDYLERIAGTAPIDVKAMAVKWLNVYHAPAPRCFAGMSARRTLVTDVSLDNDEIDVTESVSVKTADGESRMRLVELLDGLGGLAQAFVITIIDECVSSAVATLDYAEGGAGMSTLLLSLNTTFHNPASLGSTLGFINITMAAVGGIQSCPCEVWDLREQHLVATAVFCGMLSSPLKAKAAHLEIRISTLNALAQFLPLPRVIPVETQREMLYLVVLAHRNQSRPAWYWWTCPRWLRPIFSPRPIDDHQDAIEMDIYRW